jgi:dipeptidyl aminopeptidase/acylaminoacyl peptidase
MTEKTARKADDLFKLNFIQDAQISPDGKRIAYVVSHIGSVEEDGQEEEKEFSNIWLMSLETAKKRQFTYGDGRDGTPRWSPDGKQIAFMSDRKDKPQIFLIATDGGEARVLTEMPLGVGGGPEWSPDGKQIAFTAVPASEAPDRKKPYRINRCTYRYDMMGYVEDAVQDIYTISVDGGEPQQLTSDRNQNSGPLWSPDGQEILYLSNMFPDSYRILPALKVVNLEGDVRDLVLDWGHASAPAWTPDGNHVVFAGNPERLLLGDPQHMFIIERDGGQPRCLTPNEKVAFGYGLQGDMPAMIWSKTLVSKDGRYAYIIAQDGGAVHIYRVALDGEPAWQAVVSGERDCMLLDLDESHLLYAVSDFVNPIDLYIADLDGANEHQLTRLNNEETANWSTPEVEHLLYPSSDGQEIEGWLMKPTSGQAPYPTILYIHGGPMGGFGATYSYDFHLLADAGYAVLFINPRGSTGYGAEFSNAVIGHTGEQDYEDLMAGVDFVIDQGLADADRLGCCGLSYGGFMSTWIVGHTNRFKAAVPENPVTNWTSIYGAGDSGPFLMLKASLGVLPHQDPELFHRLSPISYAHNCTTPTLLIQGENDHRCPPEQSEQFYGVLKVSGCTVEMLRLPGSSHIGSIGGPISARRAQNEALLEWMNRYVLGIEPTVTEEVAE